jgi:translation initiation factor IF-3
MEPGLGPQQGEQRIATTTDLSEHRVNERIRAREVRLIDPDGKQLGVKALPDALVFARQLDLDLVEVAPDANPPVCRIMDYNRFKYETAQKAKESRKKATNTSIKEMKYRPKIGPGDFDTKTRQVAKFLEEGHKVKITIMFRGREVFHPELGKKILDRIAEQMEGLGKSESEPRLDGRNMVMVLAPDKRAKQSAASRGPRHSNSHSADTPATEAAAPAATGATPPAAGDDGKPEGTATAPATAAPTTDVAATGGAEAPSAAPDQPGDEPAADSTTEEEG